MSRIQIFALQLSDCSRKTTTMQLTGLRDLDSAETPFVLECSLADLTSWDMTIKEASSLSIKARDVAWRLDNAERKETRAEAGPRYRRVIIGPDGDEIVVELGIEAVGKLDLVYFDFVNHIRLAPSRGAALLQGFMRFGRTVGEMRRAAKLQRPPPPSYHPWDLSW
jgi:hypothetical protein